MPYDIVSHTRDLPYYEFHSTSKLYQVSTIAAVTKYTNLVTGRPYSRISQIWLAGESELYITALT